MTTLNQKKEALVDYLKTKPIDYWTTQEEIICMLPEHFKNNKSNSGTTLDRSIHKVMMMTQNEHKDIIINNGKRAYKIATKEEAVDYAKWILFKGIKSLLKAKNIFKIVDAEDTFNLLTDDYNTIFRIN